MTAKITFQENAMRIIAVIGLIAVLLLGAWGIIQLAFFIPTFLGNIGSSITPKTETSKIATTTQTPAVVAPVQEAQKPVIKKPVAKPAAATYVASTKPRTTLSGYPDLQVRMLGNPSVARGGQVSVQFVIENVGTNIVPANWFFTASLPYLPVSQAGPQMYTYQSPLQQALYPGDKIVYTLGFIENSPYQYQYQNYPAQTGWSYPNGTLDPYSQTANVYNQNSYGQMSTVSINADPYNLIWELNEGNNTASATYQTY